MTRARAVVPARIFLNIMTSSPLWGRSPDADARMSRHGNAAQGAVEVARGDVHVGDATEGPGTCRNRGRTGAERSAIAGTTGAAVAARTTGSAGDRKSTRLNSSH